MCEKRKRSSRRSSEPSLALVAEIGRRWSEFSRGESGGLAGITGDTFGSSPSPISATLTRSLSSLPSDRQRYQGSSDDRIVPPPAPPSTPAHSGRLSHPNDCCSPRVAPRNSEGVPALHHSELAALKQRFQELDASGRGILTRSEFYRLFRSIVELPCGVDGSEESPLFDFAYNLFDSCGGEGLDMKEFISGCWILVGSEEERVRHLFHMYDKDNSGSLNIAELQQVFRVMRSYAIAKEGSVAAGCQSIGLSKHMRCDSGNLLELAEHALKQQDKDSDGHIGFEDFQKWCTNNPIVKGWMDMLSKDTARGIARIRDERERELLVKELNDIGLMDANLWPKSLNMSIVTPEVRSASYSPRPSKFGDPVISGEFKLNGPFSGPSRSATPDNTDPEVSSSMASSRSQLTFPENAIGKFEIAFDKLTFEKRIGEGTFAEVYSGRWLDSAVAIKVFKSGPRLVMNSDGSAIVVPQNMGGETLDGISFDPALQSTLDPDISDDSDNEDARSEEVEGRARFLQEVGLLMSLRHPHVLFYIGACVAPQYPLCIVSELIDGKSLFSLLHGRGNPKLTLAEKLKLTQDIARGMFYLHSRTPPVLHRDLKSANILVEQHNEMKATIIDFGLSKLSSTEVSRSNANGLCGSLVTMAPEIMDRKVYRPESDVYSFGIIAWEIFTGKVPFRNLNPAQVIHLTMSRKRPQFRPKDKVPEGIRLLIEQCWEHDSSKRPDFMLIVRELIRLKPHILRDT